MSALDDVRTNFNERSVRWLEERLAALGWKSLDLARKIKPEDIYYHKTIDRILDRKVKKPRRDTLSGIAEILRRQEKITNCRTAIELEQLAGKWFAYTISSEEQVIDSKPSERTTLWVLGSYTGLSDPEKKIAEHIVSSLPASLIRAGIRVVVGDSTMLREFIHKCRDAHIQSETVVPNPVMIFGRLRKRKLHDLFMDTINCVPDIALLIGGGVEKGRVEEEYNAAVTAGIPIICVTSTGGVAKKVKSVADRAGHLLGSIEPVCSFRKTKFE